MPRGHSPGNRFGRWSRGSEGPGGQSQPVLLCLLTASVATRAVTQDSGYSPSLTPNTLGKSETRVSVLLIYIVH